jgi:adenosylcobinamide-GDP ribazoletransferase
MTKFKNFFSALSFLTIFPTPRPGKEEIIRIGRSITYFPIVGLIIGIILAIVYYLSKLIFPLPVVAAILVTALAIISGAHHLDGLIDVCDTFVAGKTKEERLNIMSDTRIGTFGIVGVCLLLIVKSVTMMNISGIAIVVAFPVISRWILCCLICIFPSAKTSGMGFGVKKDASYPAFLTATIISLLIIVLCVGIVGGPLLLLTSLICTGLIGLIMYRLFGGLTGDCYGALLEISEVLILLISIAYSSFSSYIPYYDALSVFKLN